MAGTKRIAPSPKVYAVIRIDPETMVRDLGLDDEETLAEVKEMSPKKYLVYVEWVSRSCCLLRCPSRSPLLQRPSTLRW